MQHMPLEHNPLHTHIHTQKIDDNNELNLFCIARNLPVFYQWIFTAVFWLKFNQNILLR